MYGRIALTSGARLFAIATERHRNQIQSVVQQNRLHHIQRYPYQGLHHLGGQVVLDATEEPPQRIG